MLTDAELRNTRGKSKAYKKTVRDGLYVLVTPSGGIAFKYDDTPAAAAFHHLQTDIRTRVGAHQAFGADPGLAALSNEGSYRQVYDRVETHLILQEMETGQLSSIKYGSA